MPSQQALDTAVHAMLSLTVREAVLKKDLMSLAFISSLVAACRA